jgi:glutathione peroxidase
MRFLTSIFCAALSLVGLTGCNNEQPRQVYGLSFTTIDGKPMPLEQYKGKVLLIVNTASKCGFTPQYDGLEKLYETYKDQGFVILGVPSNDFGGQEPGTNTEIKTFCETKFNIKFPLAAKEPVTGDNAHPFYKQVRAQMGALASPHWNFYKYLISRDGHIVAWYSSKTTPGSGALAKAIEAELAKNP